MIRLRQIAATATVAAAMFMMAIVSAADRAARAEADDELAAYMAGNLVAAEPALRKIAVDWFVSQRMTSGVPALIQAMRFSRDDRAQLVEALETLTGDKPGRDWADWMLWQQAHPEVEPFDGFDGFKSALLRTIDPAFEEFVYPGVAHDIRLEEIAWGGVLKDGIPALVNPDLIPAAKADYLTGEELVFGVSINGDARAYPLRIMDWHEMFNDVIGGVPVALAYCTLCGSGILFETQVEGRAEPFVFGSSGMLYRSNKLMYDRQTNSLWNQFSGKPAVGTLVGSGIELKTRPVTITTWADWRRRNPETRVLSLDTGYRRNYTPGAPYGAYFDSPDLMFPALVERDELAAKDYVFALRSSGAEKAWPLSAFEGGAVLNDRAGIVDLVLIGDAASRSVRAYRTDGTTFSPAGRPDAVSAGGTDWQVTEEALIAQDGRRFDRLPGHIGYWFAWANYYGDTGAVAGID